MSALAANSFKSTLNSIVDVKSPGPQLTNAVVAPISPPSSTKASSDVDPLEKRLIGTTGPMKECYEGQYKFAPIKEHHVST